MRVKVLDIVEDFAIVEILDTKYIGEKLKLPIKKIRPTPTVGDELWHVEHNFWDVETSQEKLQPNV